MHFFLQETGCQIGEEEQKITLLLLETKFLCHHKLEPFFGQKGWGVELIFLNIYLATCAILTYRYYSIYGELTLNFHFEGSANGGRVTVASNAQISPTHIFSYIFQM